jgi:hypothetical protein
MKRDNIPAWTALMTSEPAVATKISRATWAGLFLCLFAMVVIRYVVVFFAYEITFGWAILKETLMWVSAALFCSYPTRRAIAF